MDTSSAWENALLKLYAEGCHIATQYDKPGDPLSRDATMLLTIHAPAAEPMIHRDFPGGFDELQEYVMEVCDGIKDHCIRDPEDADDTRWEYTYHQRLVNLQRRIAARVAEKLGTEVGLGRYCHLADSFHIYGANLAEFEGRLLGAIDKRSFEQRTIRYADVRDMMEEARPGILEKARAMGRDEA